MIRPILVAALAVGGLLIGANAQAENTRDPETHFFEQSFGDLRDDLQQVREEGKQALLIMFESEDCPWCRKMKKTVLNQPDVQDYYRRHFRILTLFNDSPNPVTDFRGRETTEEDFSVRQFRVRATPVFGFFDHKGDMVVRYTGVTRDKRDFLLLGKYVAEGHYRTMKFRPWLKKQKEQ